ALPHLLQLDADVITFECASTDGMDLPLFAKYRTDKKIGIGVISHCNTVVEPPEHVAALIRKALEYIPPERLVITTDCGVGRGGRGGEPGDRLLRVRRPRRAHHQRSPRAGPARGARARQRPPPLVRELRLG